MQENKNILIVDDDKMLGETLKLVLSDEGYSVFNADRGEKALEIAKDTSFSVVLLDLMLPDISGIDLLRVFTKKYPDTGYIVCTGYASLPSAIEALKADAYDYIIKPFNVDYLKLVIRRCRGKQELIAKNKELLEQLEKEKYKLEVILDAYNEIAQIFNLEELADFVTSKTLQILNAEKASLMIVDEATGELILKGSQGIEKQKTPVKIKIGKLIAGWVAQEGEALLVENVDEDPRVKSRPANKRYKSKSFISLPLKGDKKVLGVINVTDKLVDSDIFTEDDLRYLSLLAYHTVSQIENIRLWEKLSSLAVTDPLTGLFNHRYFQDQLNLEIMRSQRYGHSLSLIMLDIDFFKTSNDEHGHLTGDTVLRQVAWVLRENFRHVDILCRYGGDEFMAILPDTESEGAVFVAEKIRRTIENKEIFTDEKNKGNILKVTVSGGVATYHENLSKADFISRVDKALYKAKNEGRNRICVAK